MLFIFLLFIQMGYACIPMNPEDDGFTLPMRTTTQIPICMSQINAAAIFIETGVVLSDSPLAQQTVPIDTCINSPNGVTTYYNGETPANYNEAERVWVGQWIRTNCLMPCICTSVACYVPLPGNPSNDPLIFLYPHCTAPTQCFIALVFGSTGSIVNSMNPTDMYSSVAQNADVNDPSFPKVVSIGCNGCPVMT